MIKIVQINTGIGYGSIGRISDQIGSIVRNRGWRCYFVHGSRYITHSDNYAIQVGTKFEDYLHYFISLFSGCDGIGSYFATKRLIRKLKKIKPDIIHLHNIHGYYINYKELFKYLYDSNVAVVWTLHDCWPITGHCPYFDKVNCEKWKTECGRCPLWKEFPKSFFFDRSRNNFTRKKQSFTALKNLTLVPVSSWLSNIVSQSFLGKYQIEVIHNGIDIDIFKPIYSDLRERLNIPKDSKIVIGVASGWDERKGFSDFLKLAKLNKYIIIMVGNIDVAYRELPSNIVHINNTNNSNELAEYYSISDVFVNPTYSDNFPTTNIEALACGLPVITYNTGGSPEAIDKNTGVVVTKGNFEELVEAIDEVLCNGKEYYAQSCRMRAETCFNKNQKFEEYVALYEYLISSIEKK